MKEACCYVAANPRLCVRSRGLCTAVCMGAGLVWNAMVDGLPVVREGVRGEPKGRRAVDGCVVVAVPAVSVAHTCRMRRARALCICLRAVLVPRPPCAPSPPPPVVHRDTFVSLAAAPPTVYTLPDGQEIPLTAERSLAPEALFTPSLVGSEAPGLPALIAEAVDASPLDARRRLWSSVLLSGGSTLYRGFGGRLLGDLAARTRPSVRVRVAAPAERRYLPFIGGSLVANLSTFRGMCVGAAEWREEGERVLFKKTFTGAPF